MPFSPTEKISMHAIHRLVFHGAAGENLLKFDYWQFSQRDLPANKAAN